MFGHAMRQNDDELLQLCKDRMAKTIRHNWGGISFEEVYRSAYHLVLRNRDDSAVKLIDTFRQVVVDHMLDQVRDDVLQALQKESLPTLRGIYAEFLTCLKAICDMLMYLDRVYMWQNKMGTLQGLGLSVFQEHVLQYGTIQTDLRDLFLKKLSDRRAHVDSASNSDKDLLNICQMLLEIDGPSARVLYSTIIEEPFLEASQDFFRDTVCGLRTSEEKISYMQSVRKLISDETALVSGCLDVSTKPAFLTLMEEHLVAKTMAVVFRKEEVDRLVENDCFEELASLYQMVQSLPGGSKQLVHNVGEELHKQATSRLLLDEKFLDDPVVFITALFEMKDRFDLFSQKSLADDPDFITFTSSFFSRLILSHPRWTDFFASYLDRTLRKAISNNLDHSQTEFRTFAGLVVLLPDIPAFEAACIRILGKRVLLYGSTNLEFEKNLVTEVSQIRKRSLPMLERMIGDVMKSKELSAQFQRDPEPPSAKSEFHLEVLALSSELWGCKPPKMAVQWPNSLRMALEDYQAFFAKNARGRQITFAPNYGTVLLNGNFHKPDDSNTTVTRPFAYSFHVSPIQACLLLLFNDQDEWKVFDLAAATGILLKYVLSAVPPLLCEKHKLLLLKNADLDSAITADSVLLINKDFSADVSRIKVLYNSAVDRVVPNGKEESQGSPSKDTTPKSA